MLPFYGYRVNMNQIPADGGIMKLNGVRHIGIIGMGMIGDSMAVLTTGHGYRTTCIVRRPEKIPEYEKT